MHDGGEATFAARLAVVLNPGTDPAVPSIPGLAGTPFWTNREALQAETAPDSLLVLGGGPIGAELAQAFARFGTRVTVVARGPAQCSATGVGLVDADHAVGLEGVEGGVETGGVGCGADAEGVAGGGEVGRDLGERAEHRGVDRAQFAVRQGFEGSPRVCCRRALQEWRSVVV